MPALAMISPCRVATISTLGLARITSTASRRIASTRRASLLVICASSRASSLGSMCGQVDEPPFRLRDDLAGHDHDVARAQRRAVALQRRDQQRAQVVAGLHLRDAAERRDGEPGVAQGRSPTVRGPLPEVRCLRTSRAASLRILRGADAGDADAGAVDLVGAVDADEHRGQRLRRHRVGERAGMDRRAGRRPSPSPAPPRGPSGRRRTPARRSRSARPSAACAPPRCGTPTPRARRGRAASARRARPTPPAASARAPPAAAPAAPWCRPPACPRHAARSRRGSRRGSPRAP